MFNGVYFRQVIKSNIKLLIIFTAALSVFMAMMIYVFTPETVESLRNLKGSTMGKMTGKITLVNFIANSFYAGNAIIFPMAYSIAVGNRLIAEKVDKGGMAGLLATPMTRNQVSGTGGLYFIISLTFMFSVIASVGIISSRIFQPDALEIKKFIMLNVGMLLYHLLISGICFFASCVFNTSRHSLMIGAGLPLFFFITHILALLSENLSYLKYVTANTLFDSEAILDGKGYGIKFAAMGISALVLYVVGIMRFKRKDLPL